MTGVLIVQGSLERTGTWPKAPDPRLEDGSLPKFKETHEHAPELKILGGQYEQTVYRTSWRYEYEVKESPSI
jgi:hypothetical protein